MLWLLSFLFGVIKQQGKNNNDSWEKMPKTREEDRGILTDEVELKHIEDTKKISYLY